MDCFPLRSARGRNDKAAARHCEERSDVAIHKTNDTRPSNHYNNPHYV